MKIPYLKMLIVLIVAAIALLLISKALANGADGRHVALVGIVFILLSTLAVSGLEGRNK